MKIPVGIRGRLLLGFSALLALIVVSNFFSDFLFHRFQKNIENIVQNNLPDISLTASIAVKGNDIIDASFSLISAQDILEVNNSMLQLTGTLRQIKQLIEQNQTGFGRKQDSTSLYHIVSMLSDNLNALDVNARQRFLFEEKNYELITRLRWAHADFLNEVEPMTGDARFATEHSISRALSADVKKMPEFLHKIKNNNQVQEALLKINATGSLLVELIARSTELSQVDLLTNTKLLIFQTHRSLSPQFEQIASLPGALSLIQSIDAIVTFVNGEDSLFDINQNRLQNLEQGQLLLTENRKLLTRLQAEISNAVADGNQKVETNAQNLLETILKARKGLLIAVIMGIIVVFIVVWYYVGKNLVPRLLSLNKSMQTIAEGDLDTPVAIGDFQDEISDMARSLQSFKDTLRETQDELVQAAKLAALGQMAAGIAHELNQPLSAIRSYAHNTKLLLAQSRSDEASDVLERIDTLVERVADMTNQFKNLARRSGTEFEEVNINHTIDETLSFFQAKFIHADVTLEKGYIHNSLAVYADQVRLEQVLINLFQNALDAMQNSGVRKLKIDAEQADAFTMISVADTGIGLPEEELENIFDPFYTNKEIGQGVGLGLTISYNIIKDLGGSLKVAKNRRQGLTFTIKLRTWVNGQTI